MAAAHPAAFLPRLAWGPAALTRSTKRVARTLLFAMDAFATDRGIPRDAPGLARRIGWIAENVCALHGVQLVLRGRPPREPSVIVGNHLGYLDPPALCSVAPAIPIGKKELGEWPVMGALMDEHGVLLVDRDDPYSGAVVLRRALRYLERGASVLAFPEGTTTTGAEVLPFRRGIFGVARRAGVPVTPVAVRYEPADRCWVGDTYFLPHYLETTAAASLRVELCFGEPFDPRHEPDAAAAAIRARAWVTNALT